MELPDHGGGLVAAALVEPLSVASAALLEPQRRKRGRAAIESTDELFNNSMSILADLSRASSQHVHLDQAVTASLLAGWHWQVTTDYSGVGAADCLMKALVLASLVQQGDANAVVVAAVGLEVFAQIDEWLAILWIVLLTFVTIAGATCWIYEEVNDRAEKWWRPERAEPHAEPAPMQEVNYPAGESIMQEPILQEQEPAARDRQEPVPPITPEPAPPPIRPEPAPPIRREPAPPIRPEPAPPITPEPAPPIRPVPGRHILNVNFHDPCFHLRNGPCHRPDWDQRVPCQVCEPHHSLIPLDRIVISRWGAKYHVNTECAGLRNATSTVEMKRECPNCVRGFRG